MKKGMAPLLAAALLTLLAAACGGGGEQPSGGIAEIGSGGQSAEQSGVPAPAQPEGRGGVEIRGDTVVSTSNDGMGTKSTTEYRYEDGTLKEMILTFEYPDKATAQSIREEMESGDLKQTAQASYSAFRQDGNRVVCTMNEETVAVFSGMTQEELAAFLTGGQTAAGPFGGEADAGETTVNIGWDALSLPDGFPRLAEGVTSYASIDESSFSMDWDFLSAEEAGEMAAKLEEWAGAKAETYGDENGANWNISTDTRSVTLTYYADTFGGSMPQVTLGVGIWQ